jgi:hypothetical protein
LKKSLLLLLTPIFVFASASASFAADTLHLVQLAQITGTYDLYVSDSALKAVNRKTSAIFYSQAPRWQLLLCNPSRQVFTTMHPEQFSGKLGQAIVHFDTANFDNLKWTVDGKGTILGLPITNTHLNVTEATFRPETNPSRRNRIWTAEYAGFRQHRIPLSVCHALQRLYGLPLQEGIPIRVGFLNFEGERTTALETFSSKRVKVDMNYSVPANFKKVNGEIEALAAPQNNSGLEFFRP